MHFHLHHKATLRRANEEGGDKDKFVTSESYKNKKAPRDPREAGNRGDKAGWVTTDLSPPSFLLSRSHRDA